jgi:hypothetical protein
MTVVKDGGVVAKWQNCRLNAGIRVSMRAVAALQGGKTGFIKKKGRTDPAFLSFFGF